MLGVELKGLDGQGGLLAVLSPGAYTKTKSEGTETPYELALTATTRPKKPVTLCQ
jgi:hypothetical protein